MSKKILLTMAAVLAALPIAFVLHGQSPQLPHMERTKFPKDDSAEAMFLVLFGEKTGHPEDGRARSPSLRANWKTCAATNSSRRTGWNCPIAGALQSAPRS